MRDIKITLSRDPKLRSPDVFEEARWLQDSGAIYYQLSTMPKYAKAGCFVYFIRNGQLVARAVADDFLRMEVDELGGSYTGVPTTKGGIRVKVMPPMEIAVTPIDHKGFQGYHYVKEEERQAFQGAFTKNDN